MCHFINNHPSVLQDYVTNSFRVCILGRARWGDARHRTTLIHMCAGIRISLSSDIQRDGSVWRDLRWPRGHRNEDGDKCVRGQYTWVFPTANTMPLRARPRKCLTCERVLDPVHVSQQQQQQHNTINYCVTTSKWLHQQATLLHYTQMAYLICFCLVYPTNLSFNKCIGRHTSGWFGRNELWCTQKKASVVIILSGNLSDGTDESHKKLYSG
jgi:hypothetical protein